MGLSCLKRGQLACYMFLLFFSALPAQGATSIDMVTFNIHWFGAKFKDPRGKKPRPIDPRKIEERTQIIRDFMQRVVRPQDVMAFEEVVDMQLLQAIVPQGWNCVSYENHNPSHQRVAICASAQFRFLPVPYDNNSAIEEVASDREWSRPALRVDLADMKGRRLMRLVAVHLKAMSNFSKERMRQVGAIANDLRKSAAVPTVIMGDLNSYWSQQTGNDRDDIDAFTEILQEADSSFSHVKHRSRFTFRSFQHRSQLDHFIVNGGVRVLDGPDVFPVCNQGKDGDGYLNFPYYYKFVSDHCPVRVRVEVP